MFFLHIFVDFYKEKIFYKVFFVVLSIFHEVMKSQVLNLT